MAKIIRERERERERERAPTLPSLSSWRLNPVAIRVMLTYKQENIQT